MATVTFRAEGDLVYAEIPADYPEGLSSLVAEVRQQLPGMWIDWVAVREAFRYGRGRPFPVGARHDGRALDEKAKVRFSEDRLTAHLLLYPPKPRGERLAEAELLSLLTAYGVPADLVDIHSLRLAHLRRTYREPETVARGHPPLNGHPARVEWTAPLPTDAEGFLAAVAELETFPETVLAEARVGDRVGVRHPPGLGEPGVSARGEAIPAAPGEDHLELGPGLALAPGGGEVVALRDGHVRVGGVGGTRGEILPLLRVRDPMELEPWSRTFYPGSVVVEGDLEVPFPVRVRGDAEVRGGVIRSQLEVMGSLLVRDGVIQHRGAPTRVGGVVSAAFFERAWVLARAVHVRHHSLKSRLQARESILAPGEASIHGGAAEAGRRVHAGTLGSRNAMPTEVLLATGDAAAGHQALCSEWAGALREDGADEDVVRAWEEAAGGPPPEPLEALLTAHVLHPAVTVRIGTAARKIENPLGPVELRYERIGPRGRVSMTRTE